MKKLATILAFLLTVPIGAQAQRYTYGNWIASDSGNVTLTNADTDTLFFAFRGLRASGSVSENSNNPPDAVYWSGDAFLVIYPTTAADNETDSLEIWIKPLDEHGNVIYGPKSWADFSETSGDWSSSQKVLDWTSGTIYGASLTGALPPCFGIAVFIKQHATGTQSTSVGAKLVHD